MLKQTEEVTNRSGRLVLHAYTCVNKVQWRVNEKPGGEGREDRTGETVGYLWKGEKTWTARA